MDLVLKVIDLGADFRLQNRDNWERIYGKSIWDITKVKCYQFGGYKIFLQSHSDQDKKTDRPFGGLSSYVLNSI
jgi:N-acetyl-gamma-glutamylphosphate reductase